MQTFNYSPSWHRVGAEYHLLLGRRRLGRVVPDHRYPRMWRPVLAFGRLGDLANLSWAKSLTLDAAVREIDYRRPAAIAPTKCPEKRGVFEAASPPARQNGAAATQAAGAHGAAP
jgi:hypothetical protein